LRGILADVLARPAHSLPSGLRRMVGQVLGHSLTLRWVLAV
jgi:hypothetical protein